MIISGSKQLVLLDVRLVVNVVAITSIESLLLLVNWQHGVVVIGLVVCLGISLRLRCHRRGSLALILLGTSRK